MKRNKELTTKDKLQIAQRALDKGWDHETMKYSDDLYGNEDKSMEIWEIVLEAKEKGEIWFRSQYLEEHLTLPKTYTESDMLEAYNGGQLDRSVGRIGFGKQWLEEYKENK